MRITNKTLDKHGIKCIPARIRKCNGFVLETSTGDDRQVLLKFIEKMMQDASHHVHGLAHKDNDWTYPVCIQEYSSPINRYGWFITKDIMDFKFYSAYSTYDKNDYENVYVSLRRTNAMYFDTKISKTGIKIDGCVHIFNAEEIPLTQYLKYEDDICEKMTKYADISY